MRCSYVPNIHISTSHMTACKDFARVPALESREQNYKFNRYSSERRSFDLTTIRFTRECKYSWYASLRSQDMIDA